MLSEKDLVFFGAILIWANCDAIRTMTDAVEQSKRMYNKIFKENE